MAKMLKSYKFKERTPGRGTRRYPWKSWMNGKVWRVTHGEDFDCGTQSFVSGLIIRAKSRGLAIDHDSNEAKTEVTFRFRPKTEEEVENENQQG
jgi:hypothetical protein